MNKLTCSVCKKDYASRFTLERHRKSVHNVKTNHERNDTENENLTHCNTTNKNGKANGEKSYLINGYEFWDYIVKESLTEFGKENNNDVEFLLEHEETLSLFLTLLLSKVSSLLMLMNASKFDTIMKAITLEQNNVNEVFGDTLDTSDQCTLA